MNSFYGGRPGNPFVIIATFSSKQEMIENFKLGAAYTAVHYDEHVLINTTNKNDPDNGKIYRRGYDLNNGLGGAEYIGTIVGPAGKAPHLEMTTQSAVDDMYESQGYDGRYSTGEYVANTNLVPGKDGASFNDTISWSCYSIRNANNEDTTAYIGFTVPYPVIDFETTAETSPYQSNSVSRVDDGSHPFYEKWRFSIAKGKKGDAVNRIWASGDKIYYTTLNYDTNASGVESAPQVVGDYSMISNVSLQPDGTFTITCTDSSKNVQTTLEWVNEIEVQDNGNIKIKYNTGDETTLTGKVKWIDEVSWSETGYIGVKYNTDTESTPTHILNSDPIKYIDNIQIDQNRPADLLVTYNTVDETGSNTQNRFSNALKAISGISIGEDGTLTVTYNTYEIPQAGEEEVHETDSFVGALQSINDVSVDQNGRIEVVYNTGESGEVNGAIKWIDDVRVNTNGDLVIQYNTLDDNEEKETKIIPNVLNTPVNIGVNQNTQKLQVRYYSGAENDIGEAINFIRNVAIDRQGRLLMKFSDPAASGTTMDLNGDGDNTWKYIGTVSAQNLGFRENQVTAANKYLSGIVNNQNQLIFDLDTTQFLSSQIESAVVQSCSIKIYNKNTTDYTTPLATILVDQNGSSHTSNVTPNLFGVHCVFNGISITTPQDFIPVDILIENIKLSFVIGEDTSPQTSIEQRVAGLETRATNIEATVSSKQNTITGAASTITDNPLSESKALISDSQGKVGTSVTTSIQLSYLQGATSNIQNQLDNLQTQISGKQNTITGAASTITKDPLALSRALVSNSQGKVAASSVSATQLSYLAGTTSKIQTQLNAKGIKNTFSNINKDPSTLASGVWKTVVTINLTAGSYLLIGYVCFDQSNGNGVRISIFSENQNSNQKINRYSYASMAANPNGYSRLKNVMAYVCDSATTLYFNIQQNSGSTLSYEDPGVQVIRLA